MKIDSLIIEASQDSLPLASQFRINKATILFETFTQFFI